MSKPMYSEQPNHAAGGGRPPGGTASQLGPFLEARRIALSMSRAVLRDQLVAIGHSLSESSISRFEKGTRRPRADTLEMLASALKLDEAQTAYVLSFITEKPRPRPVQRDQPVSDAVKRLLEFMTPAAAYVVDRRLDILAWNEATCDIYNADLATVPPRDRNVAWYLFSDLRVRSGMRDWEVHAQRIVAQCKNHWAGINGDPEVVDILHRLLQIPEFMKWWNLPAVALRNDVRKEIMHPEVGLLVLEQTVYPVGDNPNLDLVLTIPLAEQDTHAKLRGLAQRRQDRRAGARSTT